VLASARADIDAANAAFLPGLRRRDAAMIVAAYADSGLFVAGDGTVTRGRDAVARMYASRFPRLREIVDGGVVQDGLTAASADRIYEWGHAWLATASATPGAPPVRSGGAYLTVWQRGGDGHWHIARNLAW
jgi:ketosteroid isomerase-like protein